MVNLTVNITECPYARHRIQRQLGGYSLSVVCLLGVFGNVFGAVVLIRKFLRTSHFRLYMTALSIVDAGTLLSCFCMHGLPRLLSLRATADIVPNVMFLIFYPIALMCMTMSAWLTTVMTLVRFVSVARPFLMRRFTTVPSTIRLIVTTCVLAVVLNIPVIFESRLARCPIQGNTSDMGYMTDGTEMRYHEMYSYVYINGVHSVGVLLGPFTIVIILNCITAARLRNHFENRKKLTANVTECDQIELSKLNRAISTTRPPSVNPRRRSSPLRPVHLPSKSVQLDGPRAVPQLLLYISVMFLICQTPALVSNILHIFPKEEMTAEEALASVTLSETALFCTSLNAAFNFLIYLAFSKAFRSTIEIKAIRYGKSMKSQLSTVRRSIVVREDETQYIRRQSQDSFAGPFTEDSHLSSPVRLLYYPVNHKLAAAKLNKNIFAQALHSGSFSRFRAFQVVV